MNAGTRLTPYALRRTLTAALLSAAALLAGCSSAVQSVTGTPIPAEVQPVPVLITDAPSDSLVSFSLTLNSITLTDAAGKTVSILSTPTTIEICHLNGVQEALVTASIPADTYTSATFTFANPQITYINGAGTPVVANPTLASTTYTATFPTPITLPSAGFAGLTGSSSPLLIDLLASQSVTISGSTVTVNPVFTLKPLPSFTTAPTLIQNNGSAMHQLGTVVSAAGTTLVVESTTGRNITFATNSSTVFQNAASLSALTAGQFVEVDFSVQSGGTLLATRVELRPVPPNTPSGQRPTQLYGPVTSTSSGSFAMTLIQGAGPSVSSANLGTSYTVTTNSSTTFSLTPQFQLLTGLPFTPTFTATSLKAGQTVSVSAATVSGASATAATVTLVPQTISGVITAINTPSGYTAYTVTLTPGSALAQLSGASTLTVYTTAATITNPSSTMSVGNTYRFNGLVLNDGGTLKMISSICPDGH